MTLTYTISYMLRTRSALASVLALAAAAGATPIPNDPFAAPVPAFVGAPATPRPVSAPAVPQHPFMAPNGRSNIHDDAYQTDTYVGGGPLGRGPEVLSTQQNAECASLTFDSAGRIVTICVGLEGPRLAMFDPATLDLLAVFPLPPRSAGGEGQFVRGRRDGRRVRRRPSRRVARGRVRGGRAAGRVAGCVGPRRAALGVTDELRLGDDAGAHAQTLGRGHRRRRPADARGG